MLEAADDLTTTPVLAELCFLEEEAAEEAPEVTVDEAAELWALLLDFCCSSEQVVLELSGFELTDVDELAAEDEATECGADDETELYWYGGGALLLSAFEDWDADELSTFELLYWYGGGAVLLSAFEELETAADDDDDP